METNSPQNEQNKPDSKDSAEGDSRIVDITDEVMATDGFVITRGVAETTPEDILRINRGDITSYP